MFQNVIFTLHVHMYIDKDIEADNVTRTIKYIPLIKVFGFDMIIIHIHTYITYIRVLVQTLLSWCSDNKSFF